MAGVCLLLGGPLAGSAQLPPALTSVPFIPSSSSKLSSSFELHMQTDSRVQHHGLGGRGLARRAWSYVMWGRGL